MSTSTPSRPTAIPRATNVRFDGDLLVLDLVDGRVLGVPLEWFPSLRDATLDQRRTWRFIGPGIGVHWPELDEDISIEGLLTGASANPLRKT